MSQHNTLTARLDRIASWFRNPANADGCEALELSFAEWCKTVEEALAALSATQPAQAASSEDIRVLSSWLNEGSTALINKQALARVLNAANGVPMCTLKRTDTGISCTFGGNAFSLPIGASVQLYCHPLLPAKAAQGEVVADLKRLSSVCPELNLNNYGPDDVDELNAWAIEVSQAIDQLADAQPAAGADVNDTACLDALARPGWELIMNNDPECFSNELWQVHRVSGGRNDREWTLIGEGADPRAAIRAAIAASGRQS